MTATRRAHYENALLAQRARIRSLFREIATASPAASPSDLGPGEEPDAGAAGAGLYDDDAIAAREAAALGEIEEALRRIKDTPAQYGVCVRCKRKIGEERLELLPATRVCQTHARP